MVNRFHREEDREKGREKSSREEGGGEGRRSGKLEGGGKRDRSICEMLIDRLSPFPLPSPSMVTRLRNRGAGVFRERVEEDYSDSFWLADFAFSDPASLSLWPYDSNARDGNGKRAGKEEYTEENL